MALVVKNMMKEQHKAMFVALRSGELDELIGFEEGETGDESPAKKSSTPPPPATEKFPAVEEKSYSASRPAGIFSAPPPSSNQASIFGEVGLDEKSLDDAILSYLAEDPADEDEDES
jgi:hypothetical protein